MTSPPKTLAGLANLIQQAVNSLPSGAKRRPCKDPVQQWHHYYAGYSLEFAESMLCAIKLPKNATIFDPWNGSGTTTLAAAKLGFNGRGFDLNPIAVLVARARLVNPDDARGIRGFVRETIKGRCRWELEESDLLLNWLTPDTVNAFRYIQKSILDNFASPIQGTPLHVSDDHFPPLAAFLLLSLTHSAKSLVIREKTSNPTIFRRNTSVESVKHDLFGVWLDTILKISDELPQIQFTPKEPWVMVRDSRKCALSRDSVDFVLTSPPYCTRLDYAESTNFELAALGPSTIKEYQTLRRDLMGAPLVRIKDRPNIPVIWPKDVKEILGLIRSHPSKASDSYYYKTYWQYFEDAMATLGRMKLAMKPGTSAALVVQSSYYKDIKINLPSLYVEMGKSLGFQGDIAHSMPVKTVLSSIHPGTRRYRSNWDYCESIVLLRKEIINGRD